MCAVYIYSREAVHAVCVVYIHSGGHVPYPNITCVRPSKSKIQQKSEFLAALGVYTYTQWRPRTMKTSNSSRHLNGASITSQRDMIKQTVVKERSPPDRLLVFLVDLESLLLPSTLT